MAQAIPLIATAAGSAGAAGGTAAAATTAAGAGLTAAQVGAIASTAIAAGGTAASLSAQRKAQRAAEKAAGVDRAQAAIANQRAIRRSVIEGRVRQAQLEAQGAVTGTADSSAQAGALGSAQTQQAANIGFARQTAAAGRAVNELTTRASGYQGRAATFGAVANLPSQFGFDPGSMWERYFDLRD